jgi:hypothetical protein
MKLLIRTPTSEFLPTCTHVVSYLCPLLKHSKMTLTQDHWNSYPQVVDLGSIRKVYLSRQDVMVVIQ